MPGARVVALGASNLALGLQALVATARAAFGADLEVLAALGYGRSYGAPSSLAGRTLPGILQSSLWRELEQRPFVPTRAIITDVGNDVLYAVMPARILEWVEEALTRLLVHTGDVTLTGLPIESIHQLSPKAFLFFRTLFFPPCRLSRYEVFERVDEVSAGLERLAAKHNVRFVRLRREWYAFDPIHIRPASWRTAWRELLVSERASEDQPARLSAAEWIHLHRCSPEHQWIFGRERLRPQTGRVLSRGGRLWLY
ncbi:MAG: hypothetical protein ABI672_07220 [Vicinamibacteria bacterium]